MDFRQAIMRDLPQLKDMYKRIIQNMNEQDIQIWDDVYPCEFFEEDIKNNQLYVLLNIWRNSIGICFVQYKTQEKMRLNGMIITRKLYILID